MRLRWGLRRRLGRGIIGFTAGQLVTELETAGELFVLMRDRKIDKNL